MFKPMLAGLAALLVLATAASPQTVDPQDNAKRLASQPNGCGSGWTVYLVPDSIPLAHCNFRPACDKHDNCYGACEGRMQDAKAPQCEYLRCRKGGDMAGDSRCKTDVKLTLLAVEAQRRRKQCDVSIGKDIREGNGNRAVCNAFATVYEKAVKRFGDSFFQGMEKTPETLDQSKEEYEAAIREFFRRGTQADFERFNANPPSFDRPLAYVPGRGLVNAPR